MKSKFITLLLLLSAVSCSNDNSNVLQRLNEAPATVREVQGANSLFVLELANNSNGLYSAYIVPSSALSAEYKEDGLSVLISGDVTNNSVAIDGYISESKGNTIALNGLYNTVEVRTMNKKDEDGGEVPYKPCPCEEEKSLAGLQFPQGEAYMFKDSIPKQMLYQIYSESLNTTQAVVWIVFDNETCAEITIGHEVVQSIGKICNFPIFALDWNIPNNGCKVYFEGIAYESCVTKGGIATISYFDFILTKLKRK